MQDTPGKRVVGIRGELTATALDMRGPKRPSFTTFGVGLKLRSQYAQLRGHVSELIGKRQAGVGLTVCPLRRQLYAGPIADTQAGQCPFEFREQWAPRTVDMRDRYIANVADGPRRVTNDVGDGDDLVRTDARIVQVLSGYAGRRTPKDAPA